MAGLRITSAGIALACSALATAALTLGVASTAPAGAPDPPLGLQRLATGLSRPVFVTSPPADPDRLFIVEQHSGRILILNLSNATLRPTPFLDLAGLSTGSEQGLLGLAFHPSYTTNGFFFVYYTEASGASRLVRYEVSTTDPNVADVGSATPVLDLAQPQTNHNGGWIAFGSDGYLYVATGDGGGTNDDDTGHTLSTGNGQDITDNWLGKLLRIDVDGDDFPADPMRNYAIPATNPFVGITGDDEIWAYGLRNPWRASFDLLTHDLYIGDVGQTEREEVNFQPAASTGGENYGWRLREGTIATPTPSGSPVGGAPPPGAIDPFLDYAHSGGGPFEGCSVTGGVVYRGPVAALQGLYFFADYCTSDLWSVRFDGSAPGDLDGTNYTDVNNWTEDPNFVIDEAFTVDRIASFGEDDAGNLYVVDLGLFSPDGGEIFRVPEPRTAVLLAVGASALLALTWRRDRAPPRQ